MEDFLTTRDRGSVARRLPGKIEFLVASNNASGFGLPRSTASAGPLFRNNRGKRSRQPARTDRFAHIEVHASGARYLFVISVRMAGQRYDWRACRQARERANAPNSVRTIGVGKTYIHQHRIIAARHCGNGFLAGADKIGAVTELAKNRVENDAAIRIVFRAQDRKRSR